MKFTDLNLLAVGHEIQLYGAIYASADAVYLIPLPDEDPSEISYIATGQAVKLLQMSTEEWRQFLEQTDVLNVEVAGKAIVRKSQRQIDQSMSWAVYRRDGYRCRYCGRNDVALTVDHIDLWEDGGATAEPNLVTCCRRCNKNRGKMAYPAWLKSTMYTMNLPRLSPEAMEANVQLLADLPKLEKMRGKVRSR